MKTPYYKIHRPPSRREKIEVPTNPTEYLKFFDDLVNREQFDIAKASVNALKLKRWQRLNLFSVIEFKQGNLSQAET